MKRLPNGKWFGHCRICGQEKPLCDAHLYPDGLKRIASDFTAAAAHVISLSLSQDERRKKLQTLPFDSQILCRECDGLLGHYDRLFKQALLQWSEFNNRPVGRIGRRQIVVDTNQKSTDLFMGALTSLLRFSLTARHPDITLGKKYEREIADAILLKKVPGKEISDMRVLGHPRTPIAAGVDVTRIMKEKPERILIGSGHIYCMELFGLTIFIKIGRSKWPVPLETLPVDNESTGKLKILVVDFGISFIGRDLLSRRSALF